MPDAAVKAKADELVQGQDRRHGEGEGAVRICVAQHSLCELVVRAGTHTSRTRPAKC